MVSLNRIMCGAGACALGAAGLAILNATGSSEKYNECVEKTKLYGIAMAHDNPNGPPVEVTSDMWAIGFKNMCGDNDANFIGQGIAKIMFLSAAILAVKAINRNT